jgi:hypothetical protein
VQHQQQIPYPFLQIQMPVLFLLHFLFRPVNGNDSEINNRPRFYKQAANVPPSFEGKIENSRPL